jgi:hypothetical protein
MPSHSARKPFLMVKPMWPNSALSKSTRPFSIRVLRRLHFRQQVGMAADGALAEDDQRAGQDVGAFDGDADRHLLVGAAEEVRRAEADALAADDVHAVIDHLAGALGDVVLGDGRDHRRLFAEIDGAGRHLAHGVHHVGVGADAGQRLLDAFETCRPPS